MWMQEVCFGSSNGLTQEAHTRTKMKNVKKNHHIEWLNTKNMSQVNLDALIPREDLEVVDVNGSNSTTGVPGVGISALKKGELFIESLRNPEFQRGTWEWSPEKVYNLVKSFTDGDLIPAIILWRGQGNNFVIDGAHRLSALIGWVNNDYGTGNLSTPIFGDTSDHKAKSIEAKRLIEDNIGSYQDILWAAQNPADALSHRKEIAQRLSALSIVLQWVPGNASKAEASFFKINEAASPLDGTEKRLLKARNKPMAIAARAIIRSGSGHKYWGKFSEPNKAQIEDLATLINKWLFDPKMETPVKTMDVPLAGKSYSQITQELILNVVNFSNGIKIVDASKVKKAEEFPEQKVPDENSDGIETIRYLSNTKKTLANITGLLASSLGLHPVIYFYSKQGRYQVTAFMAILLLVKEYEEQDKLISFTMIRKDFEEFIWKHKSLINQATTTWGSGAKGYVSLKKLFDFIINQMILKVSEEGIISRLDSNEDYNFFKAGVRELNPKHKKDFSTESKSETFLREAIQTTLRCNICRGYLHKNSIAIDHELEKENGGIGNADNGKPVHPFCNSTKKKLISLGFISQVTS
jgi:hypothetical protein